MGLTFQTGGFNQSDSNGFVGIGSGIPPVDNLGLLTLTGVPFTYSGSPFLFNLLVNFVSPTVTSGSYSASIIGSVSGDNVGGVQVNFDNTPQFFAFPGGTFSLTVNDVSVSASDIATPITGFIQVAQSVPEPRTWATMLLGFAGIGFVMRRRRRPVLAQIA